MQKKKVGISQDDINEEEYEVMSKTYRSEEKRLL